MILNVLVETIKKVLTGGRKIDFGSLMMDLAGFIPMVVKKVTEIVKMKEDGFSTDETKSLIDDALKEFDAATGDEGISLIPGMPRTIQEEALDHFKEFVKILLYNKAKVEGYYEKSASTHD